MRESVIYLPTKLEDRPRPTQTRWQRWQDSPTNQRFLSLAARKQGYTVVRIPPACQEAFLEFVTLMTVYGHLAPRRTCPPDATSAWQRWQTMTRRLAAYLTRLRQGQSGTCPTLEVVDAPER